MRLIMNRSSDTLVSIATYNEIENLPKLVDSIFHHAGEVDILVVDDNSPDGTGMWCDEKAAEDPRVRCLHRPGKMGLGTATLAGMQYAVQHGYRYLVNLDADFSHHPRYLPQMMRHMEPADQQPYDVVVASRYVPGGGVQGWPLYRRWMSHAVNAYARWMLGIRVRDCSGSYRCYRTSKLAELDLQAFRSRGYSIYEELLWALTRIDARIDEIPIVFVDRQYGRTKINSAEACRALGVIARLAIGAGPRLRFAARADADSASPKTGSSRRQPAGGEYSSQTNGAEGAKQLAATSRDRRRR
jgi:dolichol-phosphate mannosyltransferase